MEDKEEKSTYKAFITINRAIAEQTGDTEDFFDSESEDWRAWVE